MLGVVFALAALLIAASAMAQSPKVDQPLVSSESSMPRVAVPAFPALAVVAPAPLTDDEQRQQDARRHAILMLLLNSGGRVHPLSRMSH